MCTRLRITWLFCVLAVTAAVLAHRLIHPSGHFSQLCVAHPRHFVKLPMSIVDLLSVMPFYISYLTSSTGSGFAVVRILRLARVMRVFKLAKYNEGNDERQTGRLHSDRRPFYRLPTDYGPGRPSYGPTDFIADSLFLLITRLSHTGFQMMMRVMQNSVMALNVLIFLMTLGMVIFGALIFYAESGTWDSATGKFMRPSGTGDDVEVSPFESIPTAFWFVIVTMTTVSHPAGQADTRS